MVRLFKLAWRAVFAWRKSIRAAYASIAIAGVVVVLAGSVIDPIRHAVREIQRSSLGEYAGLVDAAVAANLREQLPLSPQTSASAAPPALLASISRRVGVAIGLDGDLMLAEATHTDLHRELVYRRLYDFASDLPEEFAAGEAIVIAADVSAADFRSRVLRIGSGDDATIVRVVGTVGMGTDGLQLLIHDPEPDPDWGPYLVRIRGRGGAPVAPLGREALPSAAEGLSETGWEDHARRIVTPIERGGAVLALVLAGLATGGLVPGHLLLARRTGPSRALLSVWGFPRRTLAWFVVVVGATGGAVAAAAGSAAGLAIAAVMNARARPAAGLLPLGLAEELEMLAPGVSAMAAVTPSMAWAAGCIAVTTLLGAVTALPAAGRGATMEADRGRRLWR